MNKKIPAALFCLSLCAGCQTPATPSSTPTSTSGTQETEQATVTITNSVDFQTTKADMSEYTFLKDSDPAFVGIDILETMRFFSEQGSGILYYGRANCPWCTRAVPVLDAVAKEMGITVYYCDVNNASISDEEFAQLEAYLEPALTKDADGNLSFQIPLVLAIKDGVITDHHLSLVDDFTIEDDNSQLNEKQTSEMMDIYRALIQSAAD